MILPSNGTSIIDRIGGHDKVTRKTLPDDGIFFIGRGFENILT
jgi:hypothetical protein